MLPCFTEQLLMLSGGHVVKTRQMVRSNCARGGRKFMMMDMSTMPMGMMLGMGLVWFLVIVFLGLAIAACIKYLRS